MSPGGGWDDAVAENLKAGFFNHSFNPISEEGPAFCIWEVREGITAEQFQEFIDGPKGPDFGLGAMMNICKEINSCRASTEMFPTLLLLRSSLHSWERGRSSKSLNNLMVRWWMSS